MKLFSRTQGAAVALVDRSFQEQPILWVVFVYRFVESWYSRFIDIIYPYSYAT